MMGLLVCSAFGQDVSQKRIKRLIKRLGSRNFKVREWAEKKLLEIGRPALKALEEATRDSDPERAFRAKRIKREIERRLGIRRPKTDEREKYDSFERLWKDMLRRHKEFNEEFWKDFWWDEDFRDFFRGLQRDKRQIKPRVSWPQRLQDFGARILADQEGRAVVEELEPDSFADRIGLHEGDIIVEVNGERVENFLQARVALRDALKDRKMGLIISRDGQEREIKVGK
jgi:C-terminal processing protease CtpA/Prc